MIFCSNLLIGSPVSMAIELARLRIRRISTLFFEKRVGMGNGFLFHSLDFKSLSIKKKIYLFVQVNFSCYQNSIILLNVIT